MSNEVMVYEGAPAPLSVGNVRAQVNLIQEVMREIMVKDEHYGVIPGTGKKPSLLKAGAEKLIFTFRLVPDIEETVIDLGKGHREYRVKVRMYSQNQILLGVGIGSCTTMEGKFRFRGGEKVGTGQPIPKEYWNLKNAGRLDEAKVLIGGEGYGAGKIEGKWEICEIGEKVEHDNPADYYNTCLKMAKKRAMVDACLTVTAASDIFTQDIEDMPEVIPGAATKEGPKPDTTAEKPKPNGKGKKQETVIDPPKGITPEEYTASLKWLGYTKPADILQLLEVNMEEFKAKYPTRESALDAIAAKVGKNWRNRAQQADPPKATACADCGYETTDIAEYKGMKVCQACYTRRAVAEEK